MTSSTRLRVLRAATCAVVLACAAWGHGRVDAQAPTLETVLARAATYVESFEKQLSGIVAEESYVQEVLGTSRLSTRNKRALKSDLLLVMIEGADRYLEFRDVFEVDGRPVRDRDDRLGRLFLQPPGTREEQAQSIINESARYNIGAISRSMNTPMLAMMFLKPKYQWRFRYKVASRRTPGATSPFGAMRLDPGTFRVTDDIWVVEFRETQRNTMIKNTTGGDFPAAGRYWIDPATGTVLITELVMTSPFITATVDVSYQSEPLLGFRVPVQMRETYDSRERLEGTATYGRFRQFQVNTGEEIKPPPDATAKPPVKPPGGVDRR